MSDDSPPVAVARPNHGPPRVARNGVLSLPSEEAPEYVVFATAGGRWCLGAGDDPAARTLNDGETIKSGGLVWRIELPTPCEQTEFLGEDERRVEDIRLRVRVSSDGEHVDIVVCHNEHEVLLPARAHSYLLARLARERVVDAERARENARTGAERPLPDVDQGWIDIEVLLSELDTNEQMLNLHTHRARLQFESQARIANAGELIQRRPTARKVRIGVRDIELVV